MSLKEILKNNAINGVGGAGRYYVLDRVDTKKDLRIVVVNGRKRLALSEQATIDDDFNIVLPGLVVADEISQFKYSKAIAELEAMLSSEYFSPYVVTNVFDASGAKDESGSSSIARADIVKIGHCKYAEMPPALLEKIIPMINFFYSSGRISVI